MEFLKFFLQFGVVNTLYGALFGRPERFGIRGAYIGDNSIIGGPHGALMLPLGAETATNHFFHHTLTPFPNYDFILIEGSTGYYPTLRKLYQSCKRVIPGGYILIKDSNRAITTKNGKIQKLVDELKTTKGYEILEYPDGEGLTFVRLRDQEKLAKHSIKPINAGFWIGVGVLGGLVLSEVYKKK